MTWREDLRRVVVDGNLVVGASFRGVPFLVEDATHSGGRRTVTHEFPGRDEPFVEDLGQRAGRFPIDGYVIGDDYLTKRDALLAALEGTSGPGQLVHPYYGVKRAICDTLTTRETKSDGGICHFAIEFIETPLQAPVPVVVADPVSKVGSSADAAIAASKAQLTDDFDATGLAGFALVSAETALRSATAALGDRLGPIVTTTQELAALTGQVRLITAQASTLVRQPGVAFDTFQAVIADLADTALAAPGDVVDALIAAYAADLGPPAPTTTATRLIEAANQAAITGALRQVMAIEAARLMPTVPFVSIEEATATRDQVAALLDDQAQTAGDTVYPALVALRSDVLRSVPGATAFARVVTVTRPVAIPSLLLAYQLYGSVDQEPDILARNNVQHPGFIAGDLQVLSDAP